MVMDTNRAKSKSAKCGLRPFIVGTQRVHGAGQNKQWEAGSQGVMMIGGVRPSPAAARSDAPTFPVGSSPADVPALLRPRTGALRIENPVHPRHPVSRISS